MDRVSALYVSICVCMRVSEGEHVKVWVSVHECVYYTGSLGDIVNEVVIGASLMWYMMAET